MEEETKYKDIIPVVLSADNNYAPYLGVCIQSIISNSSDENRYNIYILNLNIDLLHRQIILGFQKKNISITFIDMNPFIKGLHSLFSCTKAENNFYTPETYFRLFLPKIFNEYDKIIYLDCDMTILKDIACLINVDIGDNFVGVTHDLSLLFSSYRYSPWDKELKKYMNNILNVKSSNYFQAGVMIWNLKKCREHDLTNLFLNKLQEIGVPKYVDQDVMNSVFNGTGIFWIDQRWDVAWDISIWYKDYLYLIPEYYVNQYKKSISDPWIIHYTSGIKPWNSFRIKQSEYFWKYARISPFYEEILYKNLKNNIQNIDVSLIHDAINFSRIKFNYYKCKILQNITFGKRRTHYKNKRKILKNKIKQVKQFLNQS